MTMRPEPSHMPADPPPEASLSADLVALRAAAHQAALAAYCPYSRFRVGAAVMTSEGVIHSGCNIENASYGLTICAERTAIASAVASGARRLRAIAVVCLDRPAHSPPSSGSPCGACRQVIAEFTTPDVPVFVEGLGLCRAGELLPWGFGFAPPSELT